MEFIQDYKPETLAFVDRDYDVPEIREFVNNLVAAEMRTFTPGNYLAHLPCPEIKFSRSSYGLMEEYQRCANGAPSTKLEIKRYSAEKPEPALEKEVSAWRNSINNVKAQLIHQESKLMNLELAEENISAVWLQHNSALEQIYNNYSSQTEVVKKETRELNKSRQADQERVYPDMTKLVRRRDLATVQRLQCEAAYQQIDSYLHQHGFDYGAHVAEQREIASRDLLSAEHNSTVRAYETVNETAVPMDEGENEGEGDQGSSNSSKRQKVR